MSEALQREEASAFIAAGLCLTRVVPPGAEAAARAGPWIVATIAERLDIPPAGIVADIGALLLGASLQVSRSAAETDDHALKAAIRRYEDAVLGRLAADGRLQSAGFAVARLPEEMHARAVGLLVAGVMARLDYDAAVAVPPGIVRQLTSRTPRQTAQRGFASLREDAVLRRRLTEGYLALVRCAQRARDLVGDADLFALENLTILGTLTQRLAASEVLRSQEAIHDAMPRRIPRRRRREGTSVTKLEDESVYPVGGFAAISTMGSLENLVTSELIYMDPPPKPGEAIGDVDLFDMRYVEGELLYYTRDEGIFVRQRRLVILAVDPDLVRARVKDAGLPWQRVVVALGILVLVTKKLVELLGDEALSVRVVFLEERATAPLALEDEMALLSLLLREWREKGLVEVVTSSWEEVAELAGAAARRSIVQVVRITTQTSAVAALDRRVAFVDFPVDKAPLEAWSKRTTELLSSLL
jgi:hypothetical protein